MRKSLEATINAPPQYTRWTGFYHAPSQGKYLVFVEHPGQVSSHHRRRFGHRSCADRQARSIAQTLIDLDRRRAQGGSGRAGRSAICKRHYAPRHRQRRYAGPSGRPSNWPDTPTPWSYRWASTLRSEGEGADREFQLLPGQNELIQQIAAVNPHTIVVLNAGGSVDASPGSTPFLRCCTSGIPAKKAARPWPGFCSETPIPPAVCPSVGSAKSPTTLRCLLLLRSRHKSRRLRGRHLRGLSRL